MTNRELLLEKGIDFSSASNLLALRDFELEAPIRIGGCHIVGTIKVGAFTYMHDGFLHNVEIGRYCSIGRNLVSLQPNHPINMVSTSPMLYQGIASIFNDGLVESLGFSGLKPQLDSSVGRVAKRKPTSIGSDVWIGTNVTIVNGVKVGHGAIIGAGSVVTKDVPPYSVVCGNPARIVKYRVTDDLIDRFISSRWWDYDIRKIIGLRVDDPSAFLDAFEALLENNEIEPLWIPKYSKAMMEKDLLKNE